MYASVVSWTTDDTCLENRPFERGDMTSSSFKTYEDAMSGEQLSLRNIMASSSFQKAFKPMFGTNFLC